MQLTEILEQKAKSLLANVPQDVQKQADLFLAEVETTVNAKIRSYKKRIIRSDTALESLKKTKARSQTKTIGDPFFLKEKGCTAGKYKALHRVDSAGSPVFCMYAKQAPDNIPYCGAHCAAFQITGNGNVIICTGFEINIIEEK